MSFADNHITQVTDFVFLINLSDQLLLTYEGPEGTDIIRVNFVGKGLETKKT